MAALVRGQRRSRFRPQRRRGMHRPLAGPAGPKALWRQAWPSKLRLAGAHRSTENWLAWCRSAGPRRSWTRSAGHRTARRLLLQAREHIRPWGHNRARGRLADEPGALRARGNRSTGNQRGSRWRRRSRQGSAWNGGSRRRTGEHYMCRRCLRGVGTGGFRMCWRMRGSCRLSWRRRLRGTRRARGRPHRRPGHIGRKRLARSRRRQTGTHGRRDRSRRHRNRPVDGSRMRRGAGERGMNRPTTPVDRRSQGLKWARPLRFRRGCFRRPGDALLLVRGMLSNWGFYRRLNRRRSGWRRRSRDMRRLFFLCRRLRHGNRGFRHLFLGPGSFRFRAGVRLRILAAVLAHNFTYEPMPHFNSDVLVDRAGMRLLLVYSEFRE
jgi:hypothetical protein